jgi:shikimate kinase
MSTRIYYLIGMMGVGKSSIGLGAASRLSIPFIDLDDRIRKGENKSISEIFKIYGEDGFRNLEKNYLHSIDFAGNNHAVVSTGGGTPAFFDNMEYMNKNGKTIWLETPFDIIIDRLKDMRDDRPLLTSMSDQQVALHFSQLFKNRLPFYQKAHYRLENIGYDDEIIAKLVKIIQDDQINN